MKAWYHRCLWSLSWLLSWASSARGTTSWPWEPPRAPTTCATAATRASAVPRPSCAALTATLTRAATARRCGRPRRRRCCGWTRAAPSSGMMVRQRPQMDCIQVASLTSENTPAPFINRKVTVKAGGGVHVFQKLHPDHYERLRGSFAFTMHDAVAEGWVRIKEDNKVYMEPMAFSAAVTRPKPADPPGVLKDARYGRVLRTWDPQASHEALTFSGRTAKLVGAPLALPRSAVAKINVPLRRQDTGFSMSILVKHAGSSDIPDAVKIGLMQAWATWVRPPACTCCSAW